MCGVMCSDYCFAYDTLTSSCVLMCATFPDQPQPCPANTTYPVTTIGYKKAANSVCVGGLSLLPAPNQTRLCPTPLPPPASPQRPPLTPSPNIFSPVRFLFSL
jgi:hypothetical protein